MKNRVILMLIVLASWGVELLGGIFIILSFPAGGILASMANALVALYFWLHIAWAGFSFLWPTYERFKLGARKPSASEQQRLETVLAVFTQAKPGIVLPRCMIVDRLGLRLCWIGSVLVMDQPLLQHRHVHALLAHQLGYASQNPLARGLFAMLPECYTLALGAIGLPMGIGRLLLYPMWQWYWRQQVFAADRYAATLGQGRTLIRALSDLSLRSDRTTRFGSWLRSTPSIEKRIHHLEHCVAHGSTLANRCLSGEEAL